MQCSIKYEQTFGGYINVKKYKCKQCVPHKHLLLHCIANNKGHMGNFIEVNQQGHEADRLPPFTAKVHS